MIESLEVQTYTNWELCIANASPEDAAMSEVLREYTSKDARVKVENLKENLGIAENNQRIGTLVADGKLGFGAVNLVFAVMFIVFEIVFFIKRSREKRDLSEEKAE